jgi:hypothetical protein
MMVSINRTQRRETKNLPEGLGVDAVRAETRAPLSVTYCSPWSHLISTRRDVSTKLGDEVTPLNYARGESLFDLRLEDMELRCCFSLMEERSRGRTQGTLDPSWSILLLRTSSLAGFFRHRQSLDPSASWAHRRHL